MFKRKKSGINVTIVSSDTEIKGTLRSESILEIYGRVEVGRDELAVDTESFVRIAKPAKVFGGIRCKDLEVEGYVDGDVICQGNVKLRKGCTVLGSIISASLVIEDGVSFNGSVTMVVDQKEVETYDLGVDSTQ